MISNVAFDIKISVSNMCIALVGAIETVGFAVVGLLLGETEGTYVGAEDGRKVGAVGS